MRVAEAAQRGDGTERTKLKTEEGERGEKLGGHTRQDEELILAKEVSMGC